MRRTILTFAALLATLLLGSGVALAATIVGTGGDDTRNGTANRDVMYGLGGNDSLNGRGGNDEIDGGAGSDASLNGATGNDIIYREDGSIDDIDCGVYASPDNSASDSDTVYADRTSDGDPVNDILHNCKTVN